MLMAIWRRKPEGRVLIHSDQGVQYTSSDWKKFTKDNSLDLSMSRRGYCHDNAVAESFFSLLKTERIKRKIYKKGMRRGQRFSITSNLVTTQDVAMGTMMEYLR